MARSGLYKSDIQKARATLIAQGINPSVDAIRVALGNTGSKTTIHKYLKEISEEADAGPTGRNSISESLHELVASLAARLQEEADRRIELIQKEGADQTQYHRIAVEQLNNDLARLETQLAGLRSDLQAERAAHETTLHLLQEETIVRHTLEEQTSGLKQRLADNDIYRQSLEEKHTQARSSLEHYRESVKDQREQDQRRHQQQIQELQAEVRMLQQSIVVKQSDVTRLNHEAAQLVSDLSHTTKLLHEQQTRNRDLENKLERLEGMQQRYELLKAQFEAQEDSRKKAQSDLDQESAACIALKEQIQVLQIALTTSETKLEMQQQITTQMQALLGKRVRN